MNRRGFLKGCLVAGVAPAFVKADSLMGLYVPNNKIIMANGSSIAFARGNQNMQDCYNFSEIWAKEVLEAYKSNIFHQTRYGYIND